MVNLEIFSLIVIFVYINKSVKATWQYDRKYILKNRQAKT